MPPKKNNPTLPRVLVADDNREMRNTVVRLLAGEFEVVGTVGDGRALVEAESRLQPQLGIFDISMPLMSGIEAAIEIKRRGSAMKIVFLTVNEDADFVAAALDTGATGYVVKRNMVTDLILALKEAAAGRRFVSPSCGVSSDDPSGNRG